MSNEDDIAGDSKDIAGDSVDSDDYARLPNNYPPRRLLFFQPPPPQLISPPPSRLLIFGEISNQPNFSTPTTTLRGLNQFRKN